MAWSSPKLCSDASFLDTLSVYFNAGCRLFSPHLLLIYLGSLFLRSDAPSWQHAAVFVPGSGRKIIGGLKAFGADDFLMMIGELGGNSWILMPRLVILVNATSLR